MKTKKLLKKTKGNKFTEIDRHIELHMSKGFVTDEEILKLAELHGVEESELRDRIKQKEKERFAEIDKNLKSRMKKGSISEEEIAKLAKQYSIGEEEIRKRVKGPIIKGGKDKIYKSKPIKKSIEKIITDKLKIVGEPSLYEFLKLSPGSSLESLYEKAVQKKTNIINIDKKDSLVTASKILIDCCIAIFKTEETRDAYDASRIRSHLPELNADIDVAGMDGKIRVEYIDVLVQTAVGFGMDHEDAYEYIEEYCSEKGYIIESKQKKKRFMIFFGAILVVSIVAGIAAYTMLTSGQNLKGEYQKVMLQAEQQPELEKKGKIFIDFLNTHEKNVYTSLAADKIKEIRKLIEERDFNIILNNADKLCKNNDYEKARAVCNQYLNKYPDGAHAREIKLKMLEMSALAEDRDYKGIEETASLDAGEMVEVYINFLKKYPKSKYRDDVNRLISDMSEEYYIALKKEITEYEKQEKWAKCSKLASRYINIYRGNKQSDELIGFRNLYLRKMRDEKIFANLLKKTESQGNDYEAAKQIYIEHLKAYPNFSVEYKIQRELAKLAEQEKLLRIKKNKEKINALIKESAGRFITKKEGVITDTRSGLMWCMLDSDLELGQCTDYESAIEYVADLRTGGYQDWRLPTAEELTAVYKRKPFFPSLRTKWYWSSAYYKVYTEGWRMIVDVVTSEKETEFEKVPKDSFQCGSVRSVRP